MKSKKVTIGSTEFEANYNTEDIFRFAIETKADLADPGVWLPKLLQADKASFSRAALELELGSEQLAGLVVFSVMYFLYQMNTLEAGIATGAIDGNGTVKDLNILKQKQSAATDEDCSIWGMYGNIFGLARKISEAIQSGSSKVKGVFIGNRSNTIH